MIANVLPRVLLAASAVGLAAGGLIHAAPFRTAQQVIGAANLPAFYAGAYQALWLADSAALLVIAAVFALAARRPALVSRTMLALLALVPASTAALIYMFVGSFFAGHLLVLCGAAAVVAALRLTTGPHAA